MVADAVVAMSTNNDNSFRSDLWSACRMQTRHGKQLLIRTLDWSTPDDQVYYGDCSAAVANVTQIVLIKTEKWFVQAAFIERPLPILLGLPRLSL